MKKIAIVASLAVVGFAATAFIAPKTSDDSTFEGVVTYSMTVDNPQLAAMMQGGSMKIYIKGDKIKTYLDAVVFKQIYFGDRSKTDKPVHLLEIMGNKYQVKNDQSKTDEKDPAIKYTDETKQIAGYTCHKAEVTSVDEQGQAYTSNIYYTDDIKVSPAKSGQFKGLKGFPLEFSIKQQGSSFTMTATTVSKESVSDDTFVIPAGYKLMTLDQIHADMQNQAGGGN